MRKPKWKAPTTYEEVFVNWGPVVYRLSKQWGFSDEEARDNQAMIVEEFVLGEYLGIYDSSRGAFSTFWFSFVTKRLKRENSKKKRDPLHFFNSLSWLNEDGSLEERFESPSTVDPQRRVEAREALQKALNHISSLPPEISKRGKDGGFRTRTLLRLVNMLAKGWERKQIADYFGITEGTVSYMVRRLRSMPELLAFKAAVEGRDEELPEEMGPEEVGELNKEILRHIR